MKKSFYWAARLLCVSCGADDTALGNNLSNRSIS